MSEWQRVSFAMDCAGSTWLEPGTYCSICGLDYAHECECPGPTQEGYEYEIVDGVLFARRIRRKEESEDEHA